MLSSVIFKCRWVDQEHGIVAVDWKVQPNVVVASVRVDVHSEEVEVQMFKDDATVALHHSAIQPDIISRSLDLAKQFTKPRRSPYPVNIRWHEDGMMSRRTFFV